MELEQLQVEKHEVQKRQSSVSSNLKKKNTEHKKVKKQLARSLKQLQEENQEYGRQLQAWKKEHEAAEERNVVLLQKIPQLQKKLQQATSENHQLKQDVKKNLKLYKKEKRERESLNEFMEKSKQDHDRELEEVLSRISGLKRTLENMSLDKLRKSTPGLTDEERVVMCQKNIRSMIPEIKKGILQQDSDDEYIQKCHKLYSDLLLSVVNYHLMINQYLITTMGLHEVQYTL